ncbi:MAG TPA: FAD-dependent monooxygenase [Bryobacteraceae bacterium]|nr:FAD-dependent monooxygenase [Bryobacteraceae bacterium]
MNIAPRDIVIVGAGPTGLALAAELHRFGVPALVLDMQAAGENTSRACVVHARTLEVLEPGGATAELLAQGLIVPIFRIRDRSKVLATVTFKDLKTDYPFTLMCPQSQVEAILLSRLEALGGSVERQCKVIGIHPGKAGITLHAIHGSDEQTIQAKWVIGCDGAHSFVREQAAIPFEGGAYDESFILADVEMEWPLDQKEVTLFYSEQGLVVVAPLPGNHFRIVATVHQASSEPSQADFESILAERGPQNAAISIRRMVWSSRFHIQHRVARTLRQGHIVLAGDAAHVHSPAGGQGMNTGIQDAVSLGNALHHAISAGDDTVLDQWETERLKIAHSVVDLTDRLTRLATLSSPVLKFVRNIAVELLGSLPFAQHAMAETLAELSHR